jgi:cystathionine beta-lyase
MKYDFTSIVDRSGKDAIAVDFFSRMHPGCPKEGFDLIPMGVADMNFATAPTIVESMKKRLDHPFFGYFSPRQELYDGIIRWQKERNGADVTKDDIAFDNGVLGGVTTALNVYCSKGDNVLVHSPTYIGFSGLLKNNGYNPILSDLKQDENGIYRMDFEDMEEKIVKNKVHAAIFCSPHNPTGRVWEKWELEKFSELCEKYSVMVVSDEIWSDIIMPGYKHIPTQLGSEYLKEHTVACYSPTKTFNLAGFQEGYRVVYNKTLRDRMDKEASLSHYNALNIMSMYAHIGACTDTGMEWVDELCTVLGTNTGMLADYLNSVDGVSVTKPQGTYLLFVDCTGYCERTGVSRDDILQKCYDVGIGLQNGRSFHGPCHVRINTALPTSKIKEVIERFKKYVFTE